MKVFVLYRPNSEHERSVTDFVRDFTKRTQNELELVSLDTREGADKARVYDVTRYPAIIAVDSAGTLQKVWQGDLPLINELSYFTHD
ncbi:MAG: hypothetical protein DRR42_26490 [Gammaproteobacteria bacterium]|nr:MAG: hypothetical protein DRR42_26490 [Gammaproteobacteria bacterium]